MATFYSSFFSSGLLAPMPHEASGSASPTTPRASNSRLPNTDPFSLQIDTTPTSNDFPAAPRSANDILPTRPRSDSQGSNRPGLRRRRSSLTVAALPVTPMKSNGVPRSARNSYAVARARSGSESRSQESTIEGKTAVVGRARSGSLGGQMIRHARRMSRKPAPPLPAPPPTAPLPAPPSQVDSDAVTPRSGTLPLPIPIISMTHPPSTPRRPLARRAQTVDNASLLGTPSSFLSPMTPSEEEAGMNFGLGMGGVPSSPMYNEPAMCERLGMQVDYPSPVDGPGFVWERPDEAMKEN
ncbi:hypothetical protein DAEQUDRAFT_739179 [Daedalea quercina L-15889]|uniref:Uncharacterized protein n=1 Tax=Daedalea quercina L-15889 TaxID=1314783 RepID=A0A165P4L4_9APHY|nr:hypothetical protein DAEQUDRAFT_739179 [Daedalea quercina L-15889]